MIADCRHIAASPDSTFALLLEAQKRGHAIAYYTPDRLALRGSTVVAAVQPLWGIAIYKIRLYILLSTPTGSMDGLLIEEVY